MCRYKNNNRRKIQDTQYQTDYCNIFSVHMNISIAQNSGNVYEEAVKLFYTSRLYEVLADEESKVWHFSPEMLYSLFEEEIETGKITFPEEQCYRRGIHDRRHR